MARHPASRRVHQESTEPDDIFVARVLESTVWAKRHARLIVGGGTALLVAVAALLYYANYRSRLAEQATVELNQVRQTVASQNRTLAIRDLEKFIDRFGSTPTADEARLLLGRLYLEEGNAAKASAAVQSLAGDLDEPLGPPAAAILAAAQEAAGKPRDAEKAYLQVADEAEYGYERREALDAAARIRLERGDAKGAAELYRRLLEGLPADKPDRQVYEMRLAEAEARALAGS